MSEETKPTEELVELTPEDLDTVSGGALNAYSKFDDESPKEE